MESASFMRFSVSLCCPLPRAGFGDAYDAHVDNAPDELRRFLAVPGGLDETARLIGRASGSSAASRTRTSIIGFGSLSFRRPTAWSTATTKRC